MLATLAGILIYIAAPVAFLPIVIAGYHTAEEKREKLFWSMLIALYVGILGYCFKDLKIDSDMIRYTSWVRLYEGKRIYEIFNLNAERMENVFSIDLWFYLVGLTRNIQLLPASISFIYYLIVFYVLTDYKGRVRMDTTEFAKIVLWVFCSSQFAFILNSFRSYIGFSLILFEVYREEIQKKKDVWNLVLYIAPIFMHFSCGLLLGIRVISKLKKKPWPIIIVGTLMTRNIIAIGDSICKGLPASNILFKQLKKAFDQGNAYFNWKTGGWVDAVVTSGLYTITKIFVFGIMAFTLYLIAVEKIKQDDPEYANDVKVSGVLHSDSFMSYLIIYLLFTSQTFYITAPECFRFMFPIIPYAGMVFEDAMREKKITNIDYLLTRAFMIVAIGSGIFINIYNLNTMVDIPTYVVDIVTTGLFRH